MADFQQHARSIRAAVDDFREMVHGDSLPDDLSPEHMRALGQIAGALQQGVETVQTLSTEYGVEIEFEVD